jgi:hypothetical protein
LKVDYKRQTKTYTEDSSGGSREVAPHERGPVYYMQSSTCKCPRGLSRDSDPFFLASSFYEQHHLGNQPVGPAKMSQN